MQVVELTRAELPVGALRLDVGLLRRKLRLHALTRDLQPPLGKREPVLQLLGEPALLLQLKIRDEAVLRQLLVGLEVERRLPVVGFDVRGVRFLIEQ